MVGQVKAPSGRHIWNAVRDELRLNLYPLPFSTLAPTVYHVYFHPDDFDAIEPVAARIVAQVQQALTDEIQQVNARLQNSGRRVLNRLLDREDPLLPIEMPPAGWEVYLRADRNGDLERGQIGIVSTLAMPAPVEYGGTPTTRIVKSRVDGGRRTSTTEVQSVPFAAPSAAVAPVAAPAPVVPTPVLQAPSVPQAAGTAPAATDSGVRARLAYRDEQGDHVFDMRKDTLSVGRGGSSAWVDVQVVASPRVSREHFRLRRDASGRFYIQDVSLWGTLVDGVPIPPAVKTKEGVTQPGPELALPPKARIGLADAVVIDFEAVPAS
jgi:hypothetical protein